MAYQQNDSRAFRALLMAGVAASVFSYSGAVLAQDDDEAADDEERITVTGTRIVREGLDAPSPVTTVDALDFSLGNAVNAEQFLNTLPQTIPGFDSTSNNPGTGEASVNLRGLGANRTLVLVDGRRFITSNQSGTVDLNTIPSALIERVDIVTGGASAVYGSDAIAGVVNFILIDDFEGIKLDSSYQITEEGDGAIFNTSLTAGTNFANGRGNVVVSAGFTSREAIFQGDREEAFFTLNDAPNSPTGFSETGSVGIPSTWLFAFPDYTNNGLGINPPCNAEGTVLAGGICTTDSFGIVFDPAGSGDLVPFINAGPNTNRYNYAPVNYLQLPQERFNLYGAFTYDINENIEAYGKGIYVNSRVDQVLAPTPMFTTITVNSDNPFLTNQARFALFNDPGINQIVGPGVGDADGNGVPDVLVYAGRRMRETGGRLSASRFDAFQFQGGLRGEIWDGWQWDIFGQFGQNNASVIQTGNVSRSAYQAVVRENRANIFRPDALTDDIVNEIERIGAIIGVTEEIVLSGNMSGELDWAQSPWAEAPLAVAFGVEYRDEFLDALPDSVLGPDVAGFNQAPAISGDFDVMEYFAEASMPLVTGVDFIQELSLNGAYRYSDYSSVGGVNSYAIGGSWTPVDELRIRAQFQRAVRAPNIIELFQPQVNGFPGVADPCSGGQNGGFNNLTAAEQAAATANCTANGVPAAAVGTPLQVNAQIEGLFGGNPNLGEETADTFTIGAIWQPSFLDGLILTVDYYDITIEDVITTIAAQTIFDLCYLDGQQSFCNDITRSAAGNVVIFNAGNVNAATLSAEGIDFSLEYGFDMGEWGNFEVYSLGSYITESAFTPLPGADVIDCPGLYGFNCGEPTPEFKLNTRFDWSLGDWSARLRWTHISSVDDATANSENFTVPGVDGYNQVDLTGYWQATENVFLSVGVQNLMDTDYVLIGDASAEQSNTYPATYDTLGRQWFGRVVLTY